MSQFLEKWSPALLSLSGLLASVFGATVTTANIYTGQPDPTSVGIGGGIALTGLLTLLRQLYYLTKGASGAVSPGDIGQVEQRDLRALHHLSERARRVLEEDRKSQPTNGGEVNAQLTAEEKQRKALRTDALLYLRKLHDCFFEIHHGYSPRILPEPAPEPPRATAPSRTAEV